MVLTERARTLEAPVATAIRSLERVFGDRSRFVPAEATRTFRIATSDNLALFVLPSLVSLLAREAPYVSLRCTNIGLDWQKRLRLGELDLKLGRAERAENGLRTKVLLMEDLVCVVRKGNALTHGKLTTERYAAARHLLVAPREGDSSAIDHALGTKGLTRRVVMTVPHFLVAPFIVARSDLVLTVSRRVAKTFVKHLELTTLECPLRMPKHGLAQTWSESAEDDEGHAWLRNAIERAISSN
jgi:DNA-binding transcriptional LysR family regulator